jgi:hypothetical protein
MVAARTEFGLTSGLAKLNVLLEQIWNTSPELDSVLALPALVGLLTV